MVENFEPSRVTATPLVGSERANQVESSARVCSRCAAPLVGWGRFCPQCGADVSALQTRLVATLAGGATNGLPVPAPLPAPTLGQPTALRHTPQEVLLPTDQLPVDETLPVRPAPTLAPWVIGAGVAGGVAVLALAIFVRARLTAPDATQANTVVASAAANAAPATAHIEIAANLPRGARLTVDGIGWRPPGVSLPPGTYTLGAEAPGYEPVTEMRTVTAGQTLSWSPVLVAARSKPAVPAKAAERKPRPPAKSRATAPVATNVAPAGPAASAPTCAAAYGAKDWATASSVCARDARAGDAAAERNLGVMYQQGFGVTKDPSQAAMWFRKAADSGNRDAAYLLAQMYDAGRGLPRDAMQATTWYRKAAQLGDADAQVKVGMAYENGTGVDVNVIEAVSWYQKAAAQGNAWAENRLGWLYGMGNGVGRDDALAVKYFRSAADQGDAQAEFNVGFMYANGRGVARDDAQAVAWYRKAAAHGYAGAVKELRQRGLTP